ncbi:interactor of HORMAD1 protein 1 [Neolamprologus brichardi]|uniref:interactor of HORMAD1 protein 1 n=1 Tax=Neolamprologus brichardi TaxID=32507 RepID=UPI0003EBECFA|nr:interactor of HORMAD1 protein 1 [Neolamprologus brichardi]XP_006783371.1 interactor of HORMAD1 protein 1 [Neolamprologus brichardi]
MNHIRNIKEMLNIPTGSRNASTSGFSSLSDSQIFFESQFWHENSQSASQDMSLSSRNSQQSSQEGSDPKFSSSYHTKPLLLGDLKDKTRTSGILDKFEEDKKKAKEKKDSDHLAKECQHIRETLSNIQQLVAGTERNAAVCQIVSEKIDSFTSTLQNNLDNHQGHISQQFKTLVNNMDSQQDVMTQLKETVQKNGDTVAELDSHLQNLKSSLEGLREEQGRQGHMLEEALKLLSALLSEHLSKPRSEGVMDNAMQTSPAPEKSVSSILHNSKLEGTQVTCAPYNAEQHQVEVPRRIGSHLAGKQKFTQRQRRPKKRPLVLSQRSKGAVSDENRQPLVNKQQKPESCDMSTVSSKDSVRPGSLVPLNKERRSSETEGCFITPLSFWSQDSSSSVCLTEIDPILEKLSAEQGSTVQPGSLWQLFDSELDF